MTVARRKSGCNIFHAPCPCALALAEIISLSVCGRAAAGWQRLAVPGALRWPPLPLAAAGRGEGASAAGRQGSPLHAGPRQPGPSPQEGTPPEPDRFNPPSGGKK